MAARIAYEWFPQVLNMSVTAGVVVLFVLLARLPLRKAPKVFSYALWSVVLFRLLCPFSIPADFSLLGLADTPSRAVTAYTTAVEYVRPEAAAPAAPQAQTPADAGDSAVPGDAAQGGAPAASDSRRVLRAAAGLWLLGVLGMALYSVAAYVRVRRRLTGAAPLWENIYLADHIPSPFVMGLARPKIYLPSALGARERGYIIRHEQYHIRRGDHVVKALSFLALCVHWFNPLVWAAFLLSGKDMEMSCDEAVVQKLGVGIRADYSASLLSLATGRRIIAGTPLAFGEGDTKSRILNLVRWKTPKRWAVLLAAVVCIAVAAACAANPQGEEPGGAGRYASMEDFAQKTMDEVKTVTYVTNVGGVAAAEATAAVTAAKTAWLDKQGEVDGLAPEGVLEAWTFNYLVQVDADDVMLVGGMTEEDGWYDMEGQGGHDVVALRYGDGSYDILYDEAVNDGHQFYGYHNSYEEAIYDWYVTEQGLDLPLYVEDWTDRLGREAPMGNFPVHRYDGDGWYLYVPVSAWDRVDGYGDSWRSGYGTGSALTVYKQDQSARVQADYLVSVGWVEVEGPIPHVRHWESPIEDYYYDAPDGGSYQVRIEWQTQNITDYPFIAVEPTVLAAMAERFTVDPSMTAEPAPREIPGPLSALAEGEAITLRLDRDGETIGAYDDCWDESNAIHYFQNLQALTWEEAERIGALAGDSVTLAWGDGQSLTAFGGRTEVLAAGPAGQSWLRPVVEGDDYTPYEALRGWFDETEYTALGGGYDQQSIVIPDKGQGYLEAAAAYVAALERIHLQVTPGSKYCYSYVSTSVEQADETTAAFRERGEIGENAYCFYLTTVFVPENEAASYWSFAGNTGDYDGGDPAVPEGAMEYSRCGYITLESDGWHGNLVGTGW